MQIAEVTLNAIEQKVEEAHKEKFRTHLGASILGRPCPRAIWYSFRWAKPATFEGRMLRLFDRGNLEEERFISYLKLIGCKVWDTDEKGKQYKIYFCKGHGGGSLDGVAIGICELPKGTPCLTEFKTHNEKSFNLLQKKGLLESKFEHYVQMQLYMDGYKLEYGLYMSVNKNTDELYLEIIKRNKTVANTYQERAEKIIFTDEPMPRISKTPGWWQCTFCDYKDICFNGVNAMVNCRTCMHSKPIEKADWYCKRYSCRTVDHECYIKDKKICAEGCIEHSFLQGMGCH